MDPAVKQFLIPLGLSLASFLILAAIRKVAFRILHRWGARTETEIDDIVIDSLKTPSFYWCVAIALTIGIAASDLPEKYAFYLGKTIHVVVILSMAMAAANLSGRILEHTIRKSELPIPSTGLVQGILKGTVLTLGVLIALGTLGISITPLITALGVGGLAVALALQDTLVNLFAGIHILVERSIRVGDFIRLESGEEGHVEDITWRTTRIRMPPNNMVIIPNSKLSQSVVINYNLPEKRMALSIPVSVSRSADPERVEKILMEETQKGVGAIPGLLGDPPPVAKLIPGFGESSLDFTLVCQVQEFADQFPVQHELRKRILKRFREEGIEIPFPHRTVYLREEREGKP